MEQKPLISVIVPIYKVEKYLSYCIESILKQSFTDFELLLIDDGSPDDCGVISDNWAKKDRRIRVFHQKNAGLSAARNKGLDNAIGRYAVFIDSDDYIIDGYMNEILEFALCEDSDFVGFGSKRVWSRTKEQSTLPLEVSLQGTGNYILSEYNYNNGPWWYIFKKEKLGDLRFIPKRLCEDGLFTAELIAASQKVSIINNVVYKVLLICLKRTDSFLKLTRLIRLVHLIVHLKYC